MPRAQFGAAQCPETRLDQLHSFDLDQLSSDD